MPQLQRRRHGPGGASESCSRGSTVRLRRSHLVRGDEVGQNVRELRGTAPGVQLGAGTEDALRGGEVSAARITRRG